MAYPIGSWQKPHNSEDQDIVEVIKTGGSKHRFVDAFVKEIKVEDELWFSIKNIKDNVTKYHFPSDQVKEITVDGLAYVVKGI